MLFCILILFVVSLLTYVNYDKILNYFTNKEWQIADSMGKIEMEDYIGVCGTSSNFFIISSDDIKSYSDVAKLNFEKNLDNSDVITYSNGDFCVVAEKGASNVNVLSGNEIIWNTSINNASILGAYINKNGYTVIVYEQTGYKSLIKVFSNVGEELFTNYLASTYAIDIAISNDNKYLAIAEVDANKINVESQIKIIDIKDASENTVRKIPLGNNELVTDIEYNSNNELIVMTDSNVSVLKNDAVTKVVDYEEANVLFADISNKKNIITVVKQKNGLFDESVKLCIHDIEGQKELKTYDLEDAPNIIKCLNDIIAVDTGSEILFINTLGNFVKKCEYKGQLKDLILFNEGDTAVLLFRDFADFIKVGGI